jgi:hypothetical protein
MSPTVTRQRLLHDFASCWESDQVSPLDSYLSDYVKDGCNVDVEEWRLVPLNATSVSVRGTSPDCLADCLIELQSKYQQFVPDDWGGRMERGWRYIGVIGFNILDDVVFDVQELCEATTHVDWAVPKMELLFWERVLLHAVVDYGRHCGAKQVRLPRTPCCPRRPTAVTESTAPTDVQQTLERRYKDSAKALGFVEDQQQNCFVLNLH